MGQALVVGRKLVLVPVLVVGQALVVEHILELVVEPELGQVVGRKLVLVLVVEPEPELEQVYYMHIVHKQMLNSSELKELGLVMTFFYIHTVVFCFHRFRHCVTG